MGNFVYCTFKVEVRIPLELLSEQTEMTNGKYIVYCDVS